MKETHNFSKILAHLMHERGFTQETLADKIKVSASTISRWLNGSKPRRNAAFELASALHVRVDWLLEGEGEKEPSNLKPVLERQKKIEANGTLVELDFQPIPVLSWAHAGQAMAYEQMPDDYLEPMIVPSEVAKGRKLVALVVDGDSMEPYIQHHDQIAILPQEQPNTGTIVVAKFKHDGGVMVRRYQVIETVNGKPKKVRLIPSNKEYANTEHYINEFEWIMPVVAMTRKLC